MVREPRPTGRGEVRPEVQEGLSRSGKCGAGSSVPRAPSRLDHRTLTLVTASITLIGILANSMVSPALPDIADDLGVSDSGLGLVVAAASLPGVVVAPIIGVASDRFGRRAVILPCLVLFGLGGLGGMLAGSFEVLLASRFLQGFGGAGLVNLAIVLLGDHYEDPKERAAAIGRNSAVLTVGLALNPIVGGFLTDLGSWRLSFAPSLAAFAVALAVARLLPPGPPPQVTTLAEQLRGAAPYLRDRRVLTMNTAGLFGFMLVFGVILTVLPIDLDERFGIGAAGRGVIVSLAALTASGVSLAMGRLSARRSTWDLVLAGFAIFAVAFAGAAAAPSVGLAGMAVAGYGIGEGLVIVPLQAYAAGLAPAQYRGLMVAVWVSAARGGQALGPVLAGVCIGAVGVRGSYLMASAAAAGMALLLLAVRSRVDS
jgi:MFS family permease